MQRVGRRTPCTRLACSPSPGRSERRLLKLSSDAETAFCATSLIGPRRSSRAVRLSRSALRSYRGTREGVDSRNGDHRPRRSGFTTALGQALEQTRRCRLVFGDDLLQYLDPAAPVSRHTVPHAQRGICSAFGTGVPT